MCLSLGSDVERLPMMKWLRCNCRSRWLWSKGGRDLWRWGRQGNREAPLHSLSIIDDKHFQWNTIFCSHVMRNNGLSAPSDLSGQIWRYDQDNFVMRFRNWTMYITNCRIYISGSHGMPPATGKMHFLVSHTRQQMEGNVKLYWDLLHLSFLHSKINFLCIKIISMKHVTNLIFRQKLEVCYMCDSI